MSAHYLDIWDSFVLSVLQVAPDDDSFLSTLLACMFIDLMHFMLKGAVFCRSGMGFSVLTIYHHQYYSAETSQLKQVHINVSIKNVSPLFLAF